MTLKPKKSPKSKTVTPKSVQSVTDLQTIMPNKRRTKVFLTDDVVAQYLIDHPDFFIRHSRQIEEMTIPHPVRGVVSLPEWQLARQRNKIKQLESEITLLMEHASANEKLFESLMTLQNDLLLATDVNDLLTRLNQWAKSLGLVGAYLHLFADKWQINAPSNYCHLSLSSERFEFIRIRHLQYSYQYLGQLNVTELELLIPEHVYVGSVAISLLGAFGDLGVIVFASRSPSHYQAGQGTLLLEKISDMLPILLNRWIERKNN